jgi:hypothetical protein
MAQRLPDGDVRDAPTLLTWAPIVAAVALGYVAILHYAYVEHIAPLFTYLQYGYRTPDPVGYGVAVALVVGLALMMPRRITHPSHFIVWVLFIIAVAPSLLVPQWAPALSHGEALELALWIGACFGLVVGLGTRQTLREFVPRRPLRARTFWLLLAGIFVALNVYVLLTIGVSLTLPSFDDVYGVRSEFRQERAVNPALGYVVPLLGVVNSAMMVRGLWDRRALWVLAGGLGQLYLYAEQGEKSALLSPVAIGAAFLLLRRRRSMVGATALLGASALAVVVMAVDWWRVSNDATSLLVRRFLVTPGLVTAGYVQVFDDAPKAQLGYSVLAPFVRYPYQAEPPDLVGAHFFGDPATHANTGWLGDGFANFGYPGMVTASLILVFVLWTIDDATKGLPSGFACLFFLLPALTLAESAILTAILTHGIFVAIVLCTLAPRNGWAREGPVIDHARKPAADERNTWQTSS